MYAAVTEDYTYTVNGDNCGLFVSEELHHLEGGVLGEYVLTHSSTLTERKKRLADSFIKGIIKGRVQSFIQNIIEVFSFKME